MDRGVNRTRKFGSHAYAEQLDARVVAAGAEEGIRLRFDRIARVPNTFDAHRLIWLAGRHGVQNSVVESLFQAYFLDAEDVGQAEVLQRIARQNGLDFDGDAGSEQVRVEEAHAREQAVSGVPTFVVAGVPMVSGAQPPEVLASVLKPLRPSAA